jgi:cytosine/adenosine deaminase-related metal-dependent hydrolase
VVEGNKIAWVGKKGDIPESFRSARQVDMTNMIVSPGLVNTHNHMFQTLMRYIGVDCPLFNWLRAIYPGMAIFSGEDICVSAKLSMVELIMSGCTTDR